MNNERSQDTEKEILVFFDILIPFLLCFHYLLSSFRTGQDPVGMLDEGRELRRLKGNKYTPSLLRCPCKMAFDSHGKRIDMNNGTREPDAGLGRHYSYSQSSYLPVHLELLLYALGTFYIALAHFTDSNSAVHFISIGKDRSYARGKEIPGPYPVPRRHHPIHHGSTERVIYQSSFLLQESKVKRLLLITSSDATLPTHA